VADDGVVEQTVHIAARTETVWAYWTDPQRMCDWWGAAADLDPRPGGTCRVEMGGGGVMQGEYVELVPHERIVFTFGWEATEGAPPIEPGSTRVEVTLVPEAGGTTMTLRHSGIPVGQRDEHAGGWGHFLALLVQAAEAAA
jgi:uncharacterized protein YndB with AHSA1/START domain